MPQGEIHPELNQMGLYIPCEGALGHIKRGSAIVGEPRENFIRCAFEGGIYQQMDFVEKLTIACWRLAKPGPNVAYAHARPDEVTQIATIGWDKILRGWVLIDVQEPAAFTQWFNEEPVIGGTPEQESRAAGLILNNSQNIDAMIVLQQARARNQDPIKAILSHARAAAM